MRTTLIRRVVALALFLLLVVSAVPTFALSTRLIFTDMSLSAKTVKVGESITINVKVQAEGSVAIRGEAIIQSPSGERTISIPLGIAPGGLSGTLVIPEGMEAGTWKVRKLLATNAHLESSVLPAQLFYRWIAVRDYRWPNPIIGYDRAVVVLEFVVESEAADSKPPKLERLTWDTEVAVAGRPVGVTAEILDDAGDTTEAWVTVSQQLSGGKPLWVHELQLFRDTDGLWHGTFFAPVDNFPEGLLKISRVRLSDRTGNLAELGDDGPVMPGTLAITEPRVAKGLETEPYLVNIIHPGAYSFTEWNEEDIRLIGDLYDQLDTDPAAVQSVLNWQVLTLLDGVKALRKEIYTEPKTQFRFVPLNTTGKWWTLDKAFQVRLVLLQEAARREGRLPSSTITREAILAFANASYDYGEYLTPLEPADYANAGPALMAGVLETVARSSLPANLMNLAHRAPSSDDVSLLDRGLIWFMPFRHPSALAEHYDGGREILLYLSDNATPEELVHSFFHEMGHHFHEVYGDFLMDQPYGNWKEWYELRKGTIWLPSGAWASMPQENFAEDFAFTFLPEDLSRNYELRGSFKALSSDPDLLAAFREWAGKQTGRAPDPTVAFTAAERVQVTTGPVKGTFGAGKPILFTVTQEMFGDFTMKGATRTQAASDGTFSLSLSPGSYDPLFMRIDLQQDPGGCIPGTDPYGGYYRQCVRTLPILSHQRIVTILPFPLTPTATASRTSSKPEISLFTGKVQGRLLINGKSQEKVTLTPGENLFQVEIPALTGLPSFTMSVPIYYEPAGTPSLTASAPSAVREPEMVITGRTEPLSVVRAGGAVTASDKLGRYTLRVKHLSPGKNTIAVSVVTPGGNEATETLTVSYSPAGQ